MAYNARILKDSISLSGIRLTTLEVTFPRIVLSEFNTHRMLSKNSASSRAIPVEKQIKKILEDPFIPEYWGANQKGMKAEQELSDEDQRLAKDAWIIGIGHAVQTARRLAALDGVLSAGVHKQISNRVLEPFMWHTVICTATEWSNFDGLRRHPDAQPEIKKAADLMFAARDRSTPVLLNDDMWHLPLVDDVSDLISEGFTLTDIQLISVGRCARVSYLTHDGRRDPNADIELAMRLRADGHMSPFEHVARPMGWGEIPESNFSGNFRGWIQFRKTLPYENDYSLIMKNK